MYTHFHCGNDARGSRVIRIRSYEAGHRCGNEARVERPRWIESYTEARPTTFSRISSRTGRFARRSSTSIAVDDKKERNYSKINRYEHRSRRFYGRRPFSLETKNNEITVPISIRETAEIAFLKDSLIFLTTRKALMDGLNRSLGGADELHRERDLERKGSEYEVRGTRYEANGAEENRRGKKKGRSREVPKLLDLHSRKPRRRDKANERLRSPKDGLSPYGLKSFSLVRVFTARVCSPGSRLVRSESYDRGKRYAHAWEPKRDRAD